MRYTLCVEGTISPEELDLIEICEEPQQVVDAIFAHYEVRGFELSAEEKEIMLEL
jgi:predicted Rossmann-fold nucleotide-binding protein